MTQQPAQPPPHLPRLLGYTQLVMQQTSAFLSNDFAITDLAGNRIGGVATEGDMGSRLLLGSRSLQVLDADGSPVVRVQDPVDIGRDRYELFDPQGISVARLMKRLAFMSTRVDVSVADGTQLSLEGTPFTFEFTFVAANGESVAHVTRNWAGLDRAILGHSRYVVDIRPDAPAVVRAAIIGSCVALDLIRRKRSN